MFGRSEDIFEEKRPKEIKLTREEKKQERLQQKELKKLEKEDLKQQKAAFEEERKNREREIKQQKQNDKEDALNAKLAAKAAKKIEKAEKRSERKRAGKKTAGSMLVRALIILFCLLSGFAAAFFACYLNGAEFLAVRVWQLILAVDVFAFSTAAFYSTAGKKSVVCEIISLLALCVCIGELAYIFH